MVRLLVLDCQADHRRSMPNTAQAVVVAVVGSTQATLERQVVGVARLRERSMGTATEAVR